MQGDTVLLPHSMKVTGSTPTWPGGLCVDDLHTAAFLSLFLSHN